MKVLPHPEFSAAVFVPEEGDAPDDIQDVIHEHPVRNVVLNLSEVPAKDAGLWLKAVGPQIPDADLRVVLSEEGFVIARVLKLTAFFDWYPSVEAALRQGA